MNREEILSIAKDSNLDERVIHVEKISYRIGTIAIGVGILLLMIMRWINEDLFLQDLLLLLMLQITVVNFYQYFRLKTSNYIVVGVIGLFASLFTLYNCLVHYGIF